jgi:NADH:ubiquinone oxidoreductase subunit F (NADH-binding)/NADH:ubiquinone oxidoreductase subunit E
LVILAELSRVMREQGWVSGDAAREVAARLGVPLHRVEGLLSFYPHFRRTPPPRLAVAVCRDMSCWLRGGTQLGRRAGGLEAAGVEVREVSCLGACEQAPVCAVNGALVPGEKLEAVVRGEPAPPGPPPRRWRLAEGLPAPPAFDAPAVIAALRDAGLRGLGGAGFPAAQKWELVRAAPGTPKYVVGNADESEPGTFKDRVLLEEMPGLVLEGLWLAARVVGAEKAVVYLRHEYQRAHRALERALAAVPPPVPTEIFVSPGGYIMGEETALLEALEDRRGEPRNKPPFPGTHGLFDRPTVINNVETLAAAAVIWRRGPAWWKAQGVRGAAGLKLMAVSGHVARPDVYEIPMGTTVAELIALAGGVAGELAAFAPGGASSNLLGPDQVDTPIDFAPLQAAGSMLGSGALVVAARGTDLLALGANVTRFFRNESCGKCVPCRAGTEKAVVLLDDVLAGRRPRSTLAALDELEETLRLTSICGLGQIALGPVLSARRLA